MRMLNSKEERWQKRGWWLTNMCTRDGKVQKMSDFSGLTMNNRQSVSLNTRRPTNVWQKPP